MHRLILFFCAITLAAGISAQTTEKEKAVASYYSGFEKHDWNLVAAQVAANFNFTSPNNDDHINLDKFKEKCWPTNQYVKKANLIKMSETGNTLFLLVEITTTDNNLVRNIDLYGFDKSGKIESIEVFFGAGTKYPGNSK